MNGEWSEKNKNMQKLLGKESSYKEGIAELLQLRTILFAEISRMVKEFPQEDFSKQPFLNAKGNHSTTLGWSIWHIFRIEDIVCHNLILKEEQIFFEKNYSEQIGTDLITTANELDGEQIAEFSETLCISKLYNYAKDVMESSDAALTQLTFEQLKSGFTDEDKQKLEESGCINLVHPDSCWLIDYWCDKDVKGLLQMPFSRHWIMHIEAMNKICDKIKSKRN